jgi:hypothetical protein
VCSQRRVYCARPAAEDLGEGREKGGGAGRDSIVGGGQEGVIRGVKWIRLLRFFFSA